MIVQNMFEEKSHLRNRDPRLVKKALSSWTFFKVASRLEVGHWIKDE